MTIAELIAELQKLPQDMPVVVGENDDDYFRAAEIDIEELVPFAATKIHGPTWHHLGDVGGDIGRAEKVVTL